MKKDIKAKLDIITKDVAADIEKSRFGKLLSKMKKLRDENPSLTKELDNWFTNALDRHTQKLFDDYNAILRKADIKPSKKGRTKN